MKVVLVMVQSVNGKITRGDEQDIYDWTSKEDTDFFFSLLKQSPLIVMGSQTYEAARDKIRPAPNQLRIVLTKHPEKYNDSHIENQLEFRDTTPETLVREMREKEKDALLLVGGGEVNKSFFESNLVDEIYLTLEPKLFGNGMTIIAEGKFEKNLKLLSSKILNAQGSLLLHYTVIK